MAMRAKHAFGSSSSIQTALDAGKIDAYDILFLDGDTNSPKIGWIDRDGNPVIVTDEKADLSELETEVANLGTEISKKINAEEVDTKINQVVEDTVATVNAYTDDKVEAAMAEHLVKKYEVSHKPEGTLVNQRDTEIRIMCPADTAWQLQESGKGADPNCYYIGFKAYAPVNAVSFKEDAAKEISDTTMYYFEGNAFAGVDAQGRKYSIIWLPVAKYENDVWTYYGANSSAEKYVGWYYSVEWYNADGVVIASDSIRINLANEDCYSSIEPYYVAEVKKELDTIIEEKIKEVEASIEVVEF